MVSATASHPALAHFFWHSDLATFRLETGQADQKSSKRVDVVCDDMVFLFLFLFLLGFVFGSDSVFDSVFNGLPPRFPSCRLFST